MQPQNRLRRHADYQELYGRSRKHHARHMSFFFAQRPSADPTKPAPKAPRPEGPRIGLTVGRVLGDAVTRNRIKRRLRAASRAHLHLLDGLDIDIILHPRKAVATLEWQQVESDVATVFRLAAKAARA